MSEPDDTRSPHSPARDARRPLAVDTGVIRLVAARAAVAIGVLALVSYDLLKSGRGKFGGRGRS